MRRGANTTNASTATPAPHVSLPVPELVFVDSRKTDWALNQQVYQKLVRTPWRVAIVYALAGCAFALITAAALVFSAGSYKFWIAAFILVFWIRAWPIVLTVNIVALANFRARFVTVILYFAVLAVISIAINLTSSHPSWAGPAELWLISAGLPSLLLLAFLNRRIRAVGPLVLIFLTISAFGSLLVISLLGNSEVAMRLLAFADRAIPGLVILVAFVFLGFALAAPFGWLMLLWIRKRYQLKKTSDQTITIDAIWLLFGVVISLQLSQDGLWALSGLFAFLVYKIVSLIGLHLIRPSSAVDRKLLVLRVFALGKRSRRLFRWLAMYWRYAGSVQLIAGTDLAAENLEPHEFLDFLSGKLGRSFIDDPQMLDRKLAEMDAHPDHDGRFRVNEFFCHDNTWRMVLDRLVSNTDVVFMDLRGFSRLNGGCIFEINELINVVSLDRVQFITDSTTDEPFLVENIRQSWQHIRHNSPNALSKSPQLRMFRLNRTSGGELKALLRALAAATN